MHEGHQQPPFEASTSYEASAAQRAEVELRLLALEATGTPERGEALGVAANALLDIVFLPDDDEPIREALGGYTGTVDLSDREKVARRREMDQRLLNDARRQGISYDVIKIAAKHEAIDNAAQAEAAREEFLRANPGGAKEAKRMLLTLPPDSPEAQELDTQLQNLKWSQGFIKKRDQFLALL